MRFERVYLTVKLSFQLIKKIKPESTTTTGESLFPRAGCSGHSRKTGAFLPRLRLLNQETQTSARFKKKSSPCTSLPFRLVICRKWFLFFLRGDETVLYTVKKSCLSVFCPGQNIPLKDLDINFQKISIGWIPSSRWLQSQIKKH